MSLISRVRKQTAVYWSQGSRGVDVHGRPKLLGPVEISCRWDDVSKEFLAADGTRQMSNSEVLVDRRMKVGDYLFLGTLTDLTNASVPKENKGAFEIRRFDDTPNLRNTENLYTAYL